MYEEKFADRLSHLRSQQDISARDMSLLLGQNPGYINTIENGKAFPSLSNFFYICEFLQISPRDFFDWDVQNPKELNELTAQLKHLDSQQLTAIATIVNGLVEHTQRSPQELL